MCVPRRRNYANFQISETPSVDSTVCFKGKRSPWFTYARQSTPPWWEIAHVCVCVCVYIYIYIFKQRHASREQLFNRLYMNDRQHHLGGGIARVSG